MIFLNHRIRQQLFAHLFDGFFGFGGVGLFYFKFDEFAHACVDAGETHMVERGFDGLALRVKHAVFKGDMDFGFHGFLYSVIPALR